MKNKKFIIYGISLALICSFIGIKLYTDKNKNNNSNVSINDTQKNKPNTEVNNTKSTEELNSSVSSAGNATSSSVTNTLDITMIGTTPNTEGNTSGNLTNGGCFAKQDKWIYFTFPSTNTIQRPIYRAMSDGETGLKAITEPGQYYCINVVGDWVYYINSTNPYIYRTKTDGSSTAVVTDSYASYMYIKDGFIYYTTQVGIYKLNLTSSKGEDAIQIAKGSNFSFIYVYKNLIYTLSSELKATDPAKNRGEVTNTLCTMNLDGSNLKRLSNDNMYKFIFYSNYIFYFNIDNQRLCRMNLNGSNKIQFTFPINNYNISNNNIYYSRFEGDTINIYKSDLDGKKIAKLTNNIYDNQAKNSSSIFFINNIFVIDDNIFYQGISGNSQNLFRTKIDGTLQRQLN